MSNGKKSKKARAEQSATNALPARQQAQAQPSGQPDPEPFTFEATVRGEDGELITKTFVLPQVTEDAAMAIPGEYSYEAVMNPDNDAYQLRLGLATLEACDPGAEALAALKSLPTGQMLRVVGEWMGESSRSSA